MIDFSTGTMRHVVALNTGQLCRLCSREWEGGENLCLMSSDVLRHIRDKLYETLNTNLREKLVGCKTVYFGLVHLCRGDPCQDLGGKLNLEILCPSGLKICILFSSKVKIYIKMRIKTFLGPV